MLRTTTIRHWQSSIRAEHISLALIILVGAGLRLYAVWDQPLPMIWYDSGSYIEKSESLVPSVSRPLGYSLFLRTLREIENDLQLVVISQVLLGLLSSLLIFKISRELLPEPYWPSALVLAFVLLWPNNLLLESYLLSESLFLFLVALASFLMVSSWKKRSVSLCALSGLVFGCSSLVRLQGTFYYAFNLLFLLLYFTRAGKLALTIVSPIMFRLIFAASFVLPGGMLLLGYMWFYEKHYDAYSLATWSGILRYSIVADLVEPEFAAPDARAVEFLKRNGALNKEGDEFIVWDKESPLRKAQAELGMSQPELNAWAGRIAWKTIMHRPKEFLGIAWKYVLLSVSVRDMPYNQMRLTPRRGVYAPLKSIYKVDPSTWHQKASFKFPLLIPLREAKSIMIVGLLLSLVVFAASGFRNPAYFMSSVSVLLFTLAVSVSLRPEERYFHTAENFLILANGFLLADVVRSLRRARVRLCG